jgi:hypothetical protein
MYVHDVDVRSKSRATKRAQENARDIGRNARKTRQLFDNYNFFKAGSKVLSNDVLKQIMFHNVPPE